MELPVKKVGEILQRYQKSGYFDSNNLEAAIQKMWMDEESALAFSIQTEEDTELERKFEEIWEEIWKVL